MEVSKRKSLYWSADKALQGGSKREIEYMLSHLPGNINFDRYKRTKEKLMTYTQIDVSPYIKIVDTKRDKVEFDELNKLVGSVDRDNRNDLLEMMEKIKTESTRNVILTDLWRDLESVFMRLMRQKSEEYVQIPII